MNILLIKIVLILINNALIVTSVWKLYRCDTMGIYVMKHICVF